MKSCYEPGKRIPSGDKEVEAKESVPNPEKKKDGNMGIDTAIATPKDHALEKKNKSSKMSVPKCKYDVLAHLKRIPATMSVYDALKMSRELRGALIEALMSPDMYKEDVAEISVATSECCATCNSCITFGEEEILIGKEVHNRPLYVTGLVGNTTMNRILLDPGSTVNVLPLKTLHMMGMNVRQLTSSILTIHGFNQAGQRVMGTITLQMEIGELYSKAVFYVIDAPTSYNLLLGRPWLHSYGIVPSTLHQCFKYIENGQANSDPFKGEEVNYSDAKFYKLVTVTKEPSAKTQEAKVMEKQEAPKSTKQQFRVKATASSSSHTSKPKVIFKNVMKDQQAPEQKTSTSVKDTVNSLMTSYTLPLRKIDQSVPKYNLLITTTFRKNQKHTRRVVSFKNPKVPSHAPLKVKSKRIKIKSNKVAMEVQVQNENGMLKVKVPQDEEFIETAPASSVFQQLGKKTPPRVSHVKKEEGALPRVSIFKRLGDNPKISPFKSNEGPYKRKQKLGARRLSTVITKGSPTVEESESVRESASVNCVSCEDVSCEDEVFEGDSEFVDEAQPAPSQIEDGGQATVDELREINLGTDEDPMPIYVSALLTQEEVQKYTQLLHEYKDVFAWKYQDMPGLDPKVAVHKLAASEKCPCVKQAPRRYRHELAAQINSEVDKLIKAGFIREVKYPKWIACIVPVKKKNGQIRICIDFRNLNEACPKDEFPLPITELMVDATTGFEALSFIDGFSEYNQIKMAPEDEELTAFRTPKGIYCYTVMPFGLKNARATYQRAMTIIFNDMLHNIVECYVDDLVVKSRKREHRLMDLRRVFDTLRKHQLKMNPLKCAFGVTSGKFLGFVVRYRGIEIDPTKIKAIREMPPPRNLRELRGLQGRLAYIRRFISNLSGRCQPFTRLLKKDVSFIWDQACQNAFESIKEYLLKPLVLMAPIKGRPLILYVAVLERSLGALLAQNNDEGKENALYYLSRTLVGAESNYTPIEKICLALVFSVQKLRHYC